MKQYHDYLRHVRATGTQQANRTGIDAISTPGAMMQFDLEQGFPAVTTKKLFFDTGVVPENIGFLRGVDNAAGFRALGCNIWNKNANQHGVDLQGRHVENKWLSNPNRKGEDDLGRIYGVQWRDWKAYSLYEHNKGHVRDLSSFESGSTCDVNISSIDQVHRAIETIRKDPTNRRIIINAWRPDEFDQMALPPCHVLYQYIVNVERGELNLCMYQRSCDSFLGVPFNIAGSALQLHIMAGVTGLKPRFFTHFLADAHIYVNHLEQVDLLLSREPRPLPKLVYTGEDMQALYAQHGARVFDYIEPQHFKLEGYDPHPYIKGEMAI